MLTWFYLSLEGKMELKPWEYKPGTCLIILVYSVFHKLVMQNFTAIQSRDSISHFIYAILSN